MSQLGHYQLGYIETLSHWNQMRLSICKIIIDSDYSLCYNNRRKEKQKKRLEYSPIRVFFLRLIYFFWCLHEFFLISIHAPFVGCDPYQMAVSKNSQWFQSTHPSRGATSPFIFLIRFSAFISIHAPQYEVRHTTVFYIEIEFVISIHAPFVGCDASRKKE